MNHNCEGDNYLREVLTANGGRDSHIVKRAVIIGCAVNFALVLLKLSFGYISHSEALIADGFHSLTDVCSDIIMLGFVGVSFRNATKKYNYGYGKFETFASLMISCLLLFVAFHLIERAAMLISTYKESFNLPHPDGRSIVVVLVAMSAKEWLYYFYKNNGRRTNCDALVSCAWHHRADAMASIATLIGVGGSYFLGDKWGILDPVASLIIAVLILITGCRLFIRAFRELMDKTLPYSDITKARNLICRCSAVDNISKLCCRKSGPYVIFNIEVEVSGDLKVKDSTKIISDIEKTLTNSFGSHTMVSVVIIPS